MKKTMCLWILLVALSLSASAQMNIVKFHSGNFFPSRFKLQYERKLSDKFSVGAIGSFFMRNYLGYRIEPYSRIYLGKTSTTFNGMYFQLKGHYTWVTDKTPERELIEEYGTSMAIGYEKALASGLSFDFFVGSRMSNTPYNSISESSEIFKLLYCFPVDLGFSVGYAF
jgi:hypothetical protein